MSAKVKELLQKINFIDADMELHKRILFSLPSDNQAEIEKVVQKISDQKSQIAELKELIKKEDPEEYNKIVAIEKASEQFKKISTDKSYVEVKTLNESGECSIQLTDGRTIDCLVKAMESDGTWTVLTIDGITKTFTKDQVS